MGRNLMRYWFDCCCNLTGASRRRGLDLLFPPQCAYCDRDLEPVHCDLLLCDRCQAALCSTGRRCPRCGGSVPLPVETGQRCHHCRDTTFHFAGVSALGVYHGELRSAILQTKHLVREPLAAALGRLLWAQRGEEIVAAEPHLAVPVPMHWSRRMVRHVNSAELLADVLARKLRIPLRQRMLKRWRNARPQGSLPPGKRWANLRGALRMRRGYNCRSARVLLVDDVLTTGATANEAARVLLDAGAALVTVAVVARGEGVD